jgi:NADPH-dependent glutamate synthase beta subunit-like oxidoreductase
VSTEPKHYAVAVVGGATAGAEAAGMLAERGITVVVFDQNVRPYGKIEDGLPRWHVKLRKKEYETIDGKLDRPGVHFVPSTKIGRDVTLRELVDDWGFSAVVLAHGAWRDRPFPVEGADAFVGKGLVYQNDLIYWFNHYPERGYDGPRYEMPDGAIVVGGGLASVDVLKVLQIETVQAALARQGIDEDMHRLEMDGIPAVLEEHGLTWQRLGLEGATLYYRRRIEDMPLAEIPAEADDDKRRKLEATRRRILEKAVAKYCFHVEPLRVPVGLLVEGDRLAGIRFQRTRIEDGRAVPVEGDVEDVHAPLVVSSIGSVPEPMEGVTQEGLLYLWIDPHLGRLDGYDSVFSTGNVVTGKGNIVASRRHSKVVTAHVINDHLGVTNGSGPSAASLVAQVQARAALDGDALGRLLRRVAARQEAVGFTGSYGQWIERMTPADLA